MCRRHKIKDDDIKKLYNQNLNDREIGDVFGVPSYIIRYRRLKMKLNANHPEGYQEVHSKQKIKELYVRGLTDKEISDNIGCSVGVVCSWRNRNGLCPNTACGVPKIKYIPREEDKPWHDPESLFCDGDFLEELTGKKIKVTDECNHKIIKE